MSRSTFTSLVAISACLSLGAKEIPIPDNKDTTIELPENIQNALTYLDNGGLRRITAAGLSSLDIFGGVVAYVTQSWPHTQCDWLNVDLPQSVQDGWQYGSSHRVVSSGPLIVFCDLQETFHPFSAENLDPSSHAPQDLLNEIKWLSTSGQACLARIKWTAWKKYNVVWNDEYLQRLGVASEQELFGGIGAAVYSLDPSSPYTSLSAEISQHDKSTTDRQGTKESSGRKSIILSMKRKGKFVDVQSQRAEDPSCSLPDPVSLVAPNAYAVSDALGEIFDEIVGTDTTFLFSWGVQGCSGHQTKTCFGESMGFVTDATENAYIMQQSTLDVEELPNSMTKGSDAKFVMEFSIYDNMDKTHGSRLRRERTNQLGEWITPPSLIYDDTGSIVGVSFAFEIYITDNMRGVGVDIEMEQAVPLGAVSVHPIATCVAYEDHFGKKTSMELFDTDDASNQSSAGTPLLGYLVMICMVICVCFVGSRLYTHGMLNINSFKREEEVAPLLNDNQC